MLSISATTIYCYVFLMPLILWGICRYYKMPSTLLELICLYGYSLTIFIPVSVIIIVITIYYLILNYLIFFSFFLKKIICVAPVPAVKWSFSLIAFLLSGFSLDFFFFLNIKLTIQKKKEFLFQRIFFRQEKKKTNFLHLFWPQ